MVIIEMEGGGKIELELYPEYAPKTVENFEELVKSGFYDGLTFHRVIKGFMIQGGDPLGNGMGGADENIYGEFRANGHNNPIRHERGVISMARSFMPNSASSQFFICVAPCQYLDGQYAAFGKVSDQESLDVAVEISKSKTGRWMHFDDVPVEPVVIKTIKIVE